MDKPRKKRVVAVKLMVDPEKARVIKKAQALIRRSERLGDWRIEAVPRRGRSAAR